MPNDRPTWWPPPPSRWWFRGWVKMSVLAVSGPKFIFLGHCRGPARRSFQHRLPIVCIKFLVGDIRNQIWHWVAKSSKIGPVFEPVFCGVVDPKMFYGSLLALFTPTVWQSLLNSVDWSACAKPGNEEKRRIFGGWVKWVSYFLAVNEPKFMKFWNNVGDPS